MNRYAQYTTVPVERTRMEIEKLLMQYGASEFLCGQKENVAMLAFKIKNRMVKMTIPIPLTMDAQKTPAGRTRHNIEMIAKVREQSGRQRWRAVFLIIKAKLEAVEAGISSFEKEFLADLLLGDGRTLGQLIAGKLDDITKNAQIPGLPESPKDDKPSEPPKTIIDELPGTLKDQDCNGCDGTGWVSKGSLQSKCKKCGGSGKLTVVGAKE